MDHTYLRAVDIFLVSGVGFLVSGTFRPIRAGHASAWPDKVEAKTGARL